MREIMTNEQKVSRITEVQSDLNKVNYALEVINGSRVKKDKSRSYDSYPSGLHLTTHLCTGSSGSELGDRYGRSISDKDLLSRLFSSVEMVLITEKKALENELDYLLK